MALWTTASFVVRRPCSARPRPHHAQTAKHGSAIHRLDFMYCTNTSPNTSFVYAPPPVPRRAS